MAWWRRCVGVRFIGRFPFLRRQAWTERREMRLEPWYCAIHRKWCALRRWFRGKKCRRRWARRIFGTYWPAIGHTFLRANRPEAKVLPENSGFLPLSEVAEGILSFREGRDYVFSCVSFLFRPCTVHSLRIQRKNYVQSATLFLARETKKRISPLFFGHRKNL